MAVCLRFYACAAALLVAVAVHGAAPAQRTTQALTEPWEIAVGDAVDSAAAAGPWVAVDVPAPFEDALGHDFDGVAWYRTSWICPPEWDRGALFLEFDGVATAATVFCDGVEVGRHTGAWTPFRVELTGRATPGTRHRIEVRCDELVGHNTQGFLPIIQPHFGGIWKGVRAAWEPGPAWDRTSVLTFGRWPTSERGELRVDAELSAPPRRLPAAALQAVVSVRDGQREVSRAEFALGQGSLRATLTDLDVRPWSPDAPNLYRIRIDLNDGEGELLDRFERRCGFRDLRADGTAVLWNHAPLQVRGVLHWGYVPPNLAPHPDPAVWRAQLEGVRAMGCNLIKCCLWIPPAEFLDIAEEIGMLVWVEYPTWHAALTPEHRSELLREYAEFHRLDRSYACAGFRSITCETGHGADLGVVEALFAQCKRMVPDTLVVDDSSWMGWQRIHDFYDDHPYGNNRDWPGMLAGFREHVAQREAKPILFGEAITSDTWLDLEAWDAAHRGTTPWWTPWCLDSQREFERWLAGTHGHSAVAALGPAALDDALRNRKYQVERLRIDLPEAGYVMAVHRDFTKARMGFWDDLDRLKWSAEEWAWHGDTMLCLDTAGDARAFLADELAVDVRLAHAGRGVFEGEIHLSLEGVDGELSRAVRVQPGAVSAPHVWRPQIAALAAGSAPRRVRLVAHTVGTHTASNAWDLWLLPPPPTAPPPGAEKVRVVDRLDPELLAWLEQGGRALLHAGDRTGSLKTTSMWYLRGAPFAPAHPIHEVVPVEFLRELQTFDLEGPDLVPLDALRDQVDPILAFWESHDLTEVRLHGLAFDTRVGEGRLLVSTLRRDTAAGRWLEGRFVEHLASGPEPTRALSPAGVAAMREQLTASQLALASWQFRPDPEGVGLREGFHRAGYRPDGSWAPLGIGHWEGLGYAHLNGAAWYRTDVVVPAAWRGRPVRAVFEGVDDSYHLFVNGRLIARFGDPTTGATVWLDRTFADITRYVRFGAVNSIALRVVDHTGAGGIWRPAFLTTGPADPALDWVHGPR